MQTIVELPAYQRQASKHLDASEQEEIVAFLAQFPTAGVLLKGAGGIRKLRWALQGKGKSGMATIKKSEFECIQRGLKEALAFSKGKCKGAIVHHVEPLDVKNIRNGFGMSQTRFALAFGISVSTLRHWERGDRTPHGPARVLLNIVARNPKAVLQALGMSAAR